MSACDGIRQCITDIDASPANTRHVDTLHNQLSVRLLPTEPVVATCSTMHDRALERLEKVQLALPTLKKLHGSDLVVAFMIIFRSVTIDRSKTLAEWENIKTRVLECNTRYVVCARTISAGLIVDLDGNLKRITETNFDSTC